MPARILLALTLTGLLFASFARLHGDGPLGDQRWAPYKQNVCGASGCTSN